MGPQPLSRVKATASYNFKIPISAANVELGTIVLSTNNTNAVIDYMWSLIVVDLMHADPKSGSAMYQALSGAEARRAALIAVAIARLSPDDAELFQAVMKAVAAQRRRRNEFAHHLWGISPEIPDALLLADPAIFTEQQVGALVANQQMQQTGRVVAPANVDRSRIQVYRRKDLLEAHEEALTAYATVSDLGNGLHWGEGALIVEPERTQLLAQPLVGRALKSKNPRNAPGVPPERPP